MTLEGFIGDFEEAVEDLEPGSVNGETRFRELEQWDSLAVLTVTAMIDADYEVRLRADELKGCATVAELFELVKGRAGA
jgi:acyl carrier protein